MKKLIPFRKEIEFKTNLYEVTSISLEHTLKKDGNNVSGSFTLEGEYRITEASLNTNPFSYELPFTIKIDDIYDTTDSKIDIDDFYYEILDNKTLVVNIEVRIDDLKEILMERSNNMDLDNVNIDIEDSNILIENDAKTLFSNFDDDIYVSYKVYIVRDGDSIDTIMSKYHVDKELLDSYNDTSNIKIGDKIIIPYVKN